ncbi:MAG: hypothetical protein UZ17_ACD001000893 [Acidobacteria bacterium OLB17]|nr:MAG: hypothetical protein UZ17_ACD001000893 [Acidobacteria bacterium OLB17]MCZ2390009.1 hypothetical protein [Acidobacteriota bacterium]
MKRTPEEKLLNPRPGSKIAEAAEFGIDLTLLVENLRKSPAQRLRDNDSAVNDLLRFEAALKRARQKTKENVR